MTTDFVREPLVKLGSVRKTPDYDYLQFFYGILLVLAMTAVLGWAWGDGYFQMAYESIGMPFMLIFGGIMFFGMGYGLVQMWQYASALNRVKNHELDSEEVESLFGTAQFKGMHVAELEQIIRDTLWRKTDSLDYAARLVFQFGFFGTLSGYAGVLFILPCARCVSGTQIRSFL